MPSVLFRAAKIRYADLRLEEAGAYARLHLQTDLSGPVQDAMGWGEIPEGVTSAKLTGKISGHSLVLTPNDKALRQHEIQMECGDIGDFALVGQKNDDGELNGYRLNFQARTVEVGALTKVENYLRLCGGCDAALKISFEKQGALELNADACADDSEAEEASEYASEDSSDAGAPLPSAVQMAGNTDKLKRQRRARSNGKPGTDPAAAEWQSSAEVVEA